MLEQIIIAHVRYKTKLEVRLHKIWYSAITGVYPSSFDTVNCAFLGSYQRVKATPYPKRR